MKIRIGRQEKLCLLLFIFTFFSNDTALFGTVDIMWLQAIPRYFYLVFCFVAGLSFLLHKSKLLKNYRKFIVLILFMLVFAIVSLLNHEHLSRAVIKELCILSGFLVCSEYSFDEYSIGFCKAVYFLSVFSIIMWLCTIFVPGLISKLPQISYIGLNPRKIRIGLFSTIGNEFIGSLFPRAQSVFWEPSVYQIYLNLALLFELFQEKREKKHIFVFLFALVTTLSTAGFVSLLFLGFSYILFARNTIRKGWAKAAALVGLLVGVWLLLSITEDSFLYKYVFYKFSATSGNGNVRRASLICGIQMALDNPLHGVGMENIGNEMIRRTTNSTLFPYVVNQMTNTYIYQFAAHGILFGSIYVYGFYLFSKRMSKYGSFFSLCVFIFILLILSSVNIAVSIVPFMLIFYGYDIKEKNIEEIHFEESH